MADEGAYLHWSFHDEHILFHGLEVTSIGTFFLASTLTIALCLTERFITFILNKKLTPSSIPHRSRWRRALWRATLYWAATIIRLLYMLIAMSFNVGLIIMIATSLAAGQLVIELLDDPPPPSSDSCITEPLLHHADQQVPLTSISTRPRSRSKPTEIFIHPQQSNHRRADAVAQGMGLFGDTDLVQASSIQGNGVAWEHGKGKEYARFLMGGREAPSQERLFRIEDDNPNVSDSDSS